MSLVQVVLTDEFVLVGAEKHGENKDVVKEDVNKLIKVNKNIIFGCTGGVIDNYRLFYGFCSYSDDFGLIKLDEDVDVAYNDFVDMITERFYIMKDVHNNPNDHRQFEIQSVVCGFNGYEFEMVVFDLTPTTPVENQKVVKIKKAMDFPYKGMTAGNPIHLNNLENLVNLRRPSTLLQYKNIMKDVFEMGIKFDNTINNNYCFEKIRKVDVI